MATALDFLRLAVEFESTVWHQSCADFMPVRPADGVYWTVRLGRLALDRDGHWQYWLKASWGDGNVQHLNRVAAQRFSTLDEAIRVATSTLGAEPEHATQTRNLWSKR